MKMIFALLMAHLLWLVAVGPQLKTDREIANLVGPVKKVKTYLIDLSRENGRTEEEKRRPSHSTTYNPEGNISEKVSYEQTGAITTRLVHTYDAKGRNTGFEEYSAIVDKSLTIARRHVYTLDEEGRKAQYTVHESDGIVGTRFVYKYDARGRKTEEEWYGAQGHLGGKSVYAFDERGNQTIQAYYHGDGPLTWKNVSRYDANGNRTEWLQYHGDILRYKIVSSYDAKGRILEQETFEYNAPPNIHTTHAPEPGKVIYAYDDEKRTKQVVTYKPGGELKERVAYTFDEQGNEIEQARYSGDGPANTFELQFSDKIQEPGSKFGGSLSGKSLVEMEYDSHGNWTRKTWRIQSEKGGTIQPHSAEQRVITYY